MSPGMDASIPERLFCFGADTRYMDECMFKHGYVLDAGCWMLDAGYWILDTGY